jgi:hypothetical protein
MKAIIIFVCTFLISCAVNIQTRNNVKSKYAMIGLTSIFIGCLNLTLLKTIPHVTCMTEGLAYIVGGACGSIFAVMMHDKFVD